MKDKKSSIAIMLVCVLLGVIVSIQLKAVNGAIGEGSLPRTKSREINAELKVLKEEKSGLAKQVEELEGKIKAYESEASKESEIVKRLSEENLKYKTMAGYEKVEGPGIILKIEEPQLETYYGQDMNFIVENFVYILQIISNLNITGAEAICINDQRYTSFTEIVNIGGNHLNVNGTPINTPIVIKAIGNPDKLETALRIKRGPVWSLEDMGFKVDLNQVDNVEIPRYNKVKEFKYARPINN